MRRRARALVRHRPLAALAVALWALPGASAAQPEPATPQVQTQDVDELTEEAPVPLWKPGDPVRVVPDMRTDGEEPTATPPDAATPPLKPYVQPPVAPAVMEENLDDPAPVAPYREGDPVRVVPDLKESDTQE